MHIANNNLHQQIYLFVVTRDVKKTTHPASSNAHDIPLRCFPHCPNKKEIKRHVLTSEVQHIGMPKIKEQSKGMLFNEAILEALGGEQQVKSRLPRQKR